MRQLPPSNRTQRHLWVAAFTLLAAVAVTTAPAARSVASSPAFSEPPLQQHRALRKMHARTENLNHEGWMDALTELDARGFRYRVISERGSNTVRGRVLKALLARE